MKNWKGLDRLKSGERETFSLVSLLQSACWMIICTGVCRIIRNGALMVTLDSGFSRNFLPSCRVFSWFKSKPTLQQ